MNKPLTLLIHLTEKSSVPDPIDLIKFPLLWWDLEIAVTAVKA